MFAKNFQNVNNFLRFQVAYRDISCKSVMCMHSFLVNLDCPKKAIFNDCIMYILHKNQYILWYTYIFGYQLKPNPPKVYRHCSYLNSWYVSFVGEPDELYTGDVRPFFSEIKTFQVTCFLKWKQSFLTIASTVAKNC